MAKKILFIEDEAAMQKAMSDLLIAEKYEIIAALDGEEGLLKAKQESPDLILLDLVLPKKDGFTVLDELKSEEETKDIPVMVLTNLETNEDIQRALDAGARTYLVKANYEPTDVLAKIDNILKKGV
ncbi:MAG: response regulator [Candidatus Spechtbacterales bacterium]